ncbi:hypothetical protein [Limnoglobus roseus]|uniref:Uncharacterized protein n=1 Tax=Limnoglobus roseus TaxID=2598579 RepID=A0A5C1AQU4_9BACT|nr:hypothetical protein [Limnoglobus roseus]QEL19238.1 hypothetical protein PX52LOC_06300 [Limnoglobus roseus]
MLRVVVALLVVAPIIVAAPPPKEPPKKASLYFPTTVGDKRVYEAKGFSGTTENTEEVTKVEATDDVYRVTVEKKTAGKPSATVVVYAVSDKGLSFIREKDGEPPLALPRLKLPAKAGDSWDGEPDPTNKRPAGPKAPVWAYTVGQEEEVEVPAGKFKAIPVVLTRSSNPPLVSSAWYAPGVGVVKTTFKAAAIEGTTVLKSFTPGTGEKKDEPKKEK